MSRIHVSKPKLGGDNEPGDANRGRGASAMKDAARLVYTLNAMTKDEAKTFGVNEHDRWAYIRMDKGKVNIVPPARQAYGFISLACLSATLTRFIATAMRCRSWNGGLRQMSWLA
jgi:hypothetical protein